MKEFITAVEDIEAEDEFLARKAVREAKIQALVDAGKTRQDAEVEVPEIEGEAFSEFKLDGRVLRAYVPTPGQLTLMMAWLGRGQTDDSRISGIINIMMNSLRESDQDYLESRLLTRDPRKRLPIKQIEAIFESLTEEWFATPTNEPSGSAS